MDDNIDDLEYLVYLESLSEDNDDNNEPETNLEEVFTHEEIELLLEPPTTNYEMFSVFGYFTEEPRYRQKLGKLLPHRIGQILKPLGFESEIPKGQSNGVDLKVRFKGKLALVAETKNYNITSNLDEDIVKNILDNLNHYPHCKKVFIFTNVANEEILQEFTKKGILTVKIGWQLLPEWFYNSIDPKYRCYRMVDSNYTSKQIKQKLLPILQSIVSEYNEELNVNPMSGSS